MKADFKIGTKYTTRGRTPREHTVTDVLKTHNRAGELIHTRYEATCLIDGRPVVMRDVLSVTIERGLLAEGSGLLFAGQFEGRDIMTTPDVKHVIDHLKAEIKTLMGRGVVS